MMQKSRFEAGILDVNFEEIPTLGNMISKTNSYSLLSIFNYKGAGVNFF